MLAKIDLYSSKSCLFNFFGSLSTSNSKIYQKGLNGQNISIEGYIDNEPKFFSGNGGKSQSYSFKLNAGANYNHGDEFILVTVHVTKWGKKVGEFNAKKGDKIKLTGQFSEFKSTNRKSGIVGSFKVNDKTYKQVHP